jgi:hypothetical protein
MVAYLQNKAAFEAVLGSVRGHNQGAYMPHLYMDHPHFGITLCGHKEMLWDLIKAMEFWHANCPHCLHTCKQICGLFVEIQGHE